MVAKLATSINGEAFFSFVWYNFVVLQSDLLYDISKFTYREDSLRNFNLSILQQLLDNLVAFNILVICSRSQNVAKVLEISVEAGVSGSYVPGRRDAFFAEGFNRYRFTRVQKALHLRKWLFSRAYLVQRKGATSSHKPCSGWTCVHRVLAIILALCVIDIFGRGGFVGFFD